VISCVKNDIALYSPHTSFDSVAAGVNDWLIEPYGESH
jgi:putative NIF3 family GTP cyclohydrolase 1 type 2